MGLDARIGKQMGVQVRFYEDYSRLSPQPRSRNWVDNLPPSGRGVFTDPSARNDRAVLGFSWSWIDLRIGSEDRRWGCGRRGTLFLSENPFPFDGLSLRIRTRTISATSLFSQTMRRPNHPDRSGGGVEAGDAYMAAHRLQMHPPSWPFSLDLYEGVVYGNRSIDLGYINPVAILVAVTQDPADRSGADDKKVLGPGFLLPLHPMTFNGEFLLNRLVTLDSAPAGRDSEMSTFAELAGLQWSDPFGLSGADFNVEYAHLDPEVYFHNDGDPVRSFLTEGELIGH